VRSSDRSDRIKDNEPIAVALDYPGRTAMRAGRAPHSRHLDRGKDPAGRLTGRAVRLIVAGIARLAGLDRVCRPHGLRHAAITEALDRGRDVRDVAKFSRHKDVRTLLIYDDSRLDVGGDIARMLEE
jgi:integrase